MAIKLIIKLLQTCCTENRVALGHARGVLGSNLLVACCEVLIGVLWI